MSSDWPLKDLESVASDVTVGFVGSMATEYIEQGIPFLRSLNIEQFGIKKNDLKFISQEFHQKIKKSSLKPQDVVIVRTGKPGTCAVIPDWLIDANCSDLVIVRCGTQIRPHFLCYWVNSVASHHISSHLVGAVQQHFNVGAAKKMKVAVPRLEEQDDIIAILRSMDDRINLLRETNTTLEAIAQALFKSWFVDFDPVRAKLEGREPEGMDSATAALFPDSFEESELGLVPRGWQVGAVYNLAQYINGAAYRAFEPNLERRGLPIIKIAELKAGVTSQTGFSDITMPSKYKIKTRDILFSWSGNPDTSIDTFVWSHSEAWLNQHIFRVVPTTVQKRSFVILTLKYFKPVFAEIARNKQTTGLGHVTVSDLKRLQVIHPCDLLLERWNEIIDPLLERAFIVDQQVQTLTALRDTLLPRLISGQLRLPEVEELIINQ